MQTFPFLISLIESKKNLQQQTISDTFASPRISVFHILFTESTCLIIIFTTLFNPRHSSQASPMSLSWLGRLLSPFMSFSYLPVSIFPKSLIHLYHLPFILHFDLENAKFPKLYSLIHARFHFHFKSYLQSFSYHPSFKIWKVQSGHILW